MIPSWRSLQCLLLVLVFAIPPASHVLARRTIPEDNLAYPVLITLKTAKITARGSGFYLNTNDATYLVTARHVLAPGLDPDPETQTVPDAEVELLSYSKDLPTPKRNVVTVHLSILRANGAVKANPSQDVVIVKIGTIASTPNTGEQHLSFLAGVAEQVGGGGLVGVALESVKTFDQVLVGNDAILYGYPVSLALSQKNPKFDPLRPLLRRALVAGQDPERHSIIIDGPVYRGNSGGPVFEIEFGAVPGGFGYHFWLIGVLTEFVPLVEGSEDFFFQFNSGYSVAKPMDFVLELVRSEQPPDVTSTVPSGSSAK